MPNLIERLDALSEAAPIEGTLSISGSGYALDSNRSIVAPDGLQGPTAEFVVALVNAYRDGTLREALRDAERLDWLDEQNRPASMGWKVSRAPYGNVAVSSVIELGGKRLTPILEALDAAIDQERGERLGRDGGGK